MPGGVYIVIAYIVIGIPLSIWLSIRQKKKKGTYEEFKAKKKATRQYMNEQKNIRKQADIDQTCGTKWIDENRAPDPLEWELFNQQVEVYDEDMRDR